MNEYIQENMGKVRKILTENTVEVNIDSEGLAVHGIDFVESIREIEDLFIQATNSAYNRGVEDSLAKVSKKNPRNHYRDEYDYLHDERHIVIDETIDNISKLLTNK